MISLLLAASLALLPFCPAEAEGLYAHNRNNDILKVSFIDVKQGDSTLIEFPNGVNILIDGGKGYSSYSSFNAGAERVVPYLKKRGIKKIDYIVMTHTDFDHIGGLVNVLDKFPVAHLVDTAFPGTGWFYEIILKMADKKDIKYHMVKAGDEIDIGDYRITLEILGPNEVAPDEVETDLGKNNNSVVIKMEFGKVSFLFTGDAELTEEDYLINTYGNSLRSTVYKVGHHGSNSSTSSTFMRMVKPEVAVISVGKNNTYGHPSPDVIDLLENYEVDVYRTDRDGDVMIETNGSNYSIITGDEIFAGLEAVSASGGDTEEAKKKL